MSSFNDGQTFMCLTRGNSVLNAVGVGPGLKGLTEPSSSFVSDKSLWGSEVCNPATFKTTNVLLGLL